MTGSRRRGGVRKDAAIESRLIGTWRIYESDLWDADYLDTVDPATMTIPTTGLGEFRFGVVTCATDIRFAGPDDIAFTFAGSDEGDEVGGSGFAELGEDGVLEIELSFHLGDDAVLKARRM